MESVKYLVEVRWGEVFIMQLVVIKETEKTYFIDQKKGKDIVRHSYISSRVSKNNSVFNTLKEALSFGVEKAKDEVAKAEASLLKKNTYLTELKDMLNKEL